MGDYSGLSRRAQCSPRVLIRKRRRQKDREIEREGERLEDVNTAGFELGSCRMSRSLSRAKEGISGREHKC